MKYSFIYFLVRNSFFFTKKTRVYKIISQNNFYFSNDGFPYRLPEIISVAKDIELVSSVGSFLSRPFRCSSSFRQNVLHCRDRVAVNLMWSVLKVLRGLPCVVDHVRMVNAEHVLEFLLTHQLMCCLQTRWIELNVKRLPISSNTAPGYHQWNELNITRILHKGIIIFAQQHGMEIHH